MKIKNVRVAFSIGSSKNLWTYQGFFFVAFKIYTFSSWFSYKHWVEVCYFIPLVHILFINVESRFVIKNLNFSFLGLVFQYFLLGLKGVSIEIRFIWYQSIGSKIMFTILLPISCYYPILFRLCSLFLVFVLCLAPSFFF